MSASALAAWSPVAWTCAALAWLPLLLAWQNLRLFRAPVQAAPPRTRVSILIPARNEAAVIGAALQCARASRGVEVEIVVLDDQSSDGTAELVEHATAIDARVRLLRAPPLEPGWAGKQRACQRLADAARFEVLMFIDADVRLQPDAAALAAGALLGDARLGLVSGFPFEETKTLGEALVIPWIHVLLLGYLPMQRMRSSPAPAYAAACGQWVVARRDAYVAVGGHGAAPLSRHDGLSLPRTFRSQGWMTDVFDGSRLARCRMYDRFGAVWHGFGKSAGEGLAAPRALPVWTVLIAGGHVLPWVFLVAGLASAVSGVLDGGFVTAAPDGGSMSASLAGGSPTTAPAGGSVSLVLAGALGVAANLALRWRLRRRLGHALAGVLLHPLGALLTLGINWHAMLRHLSGRPSTWRGRAYRRDGVAAASVAADNGGRP